MAGIGPCAIAARVLGGKEQLAGVVQAQAQRGLRIERAMAAGLQRDIAVFAAAARA
ncbi:hypothetical protein D3C71_2174850 [compost metagenome]